MLENGVDECMSIENLVFRVSSLYEIVGKFMPKKAFVVKL